MLVYSSRSETKDVRRLKESLRETLTTLTFERRIHGTDAADDTALLVEAITNPNTLSLINRVKVSRKDRVFTRVPESLRGNPDVCIDGSAVMELFGLRKSRDLDLICHGLEMRETILSMKLDLNDRHYEWLPISTAQVIEDPHLHIRLFGLKFTSLSVRQLILGFGPSFGGDTLSAKKSRDLSLISQFQASKCGPKRSLLGGIGTFITQLRLVFEFAVSNVAPKLPSNMYLVLRRLWGSLRRR